MEQLYTPVGKSSSKCSLLQQVLAKAGSHSSSCLILQYKFNLKTHIKMPFVPLPKHADLRSVIGFYLEYTTLSRKSQRLGKNKRSYSDRVVRGLSRSAATGCCVEPRKTTLFCQWGTGLGEAVPWTVQQPHPAPRWENLPVSGSSKFRL